MKKQLSIAVLALALAGAACGGDDDGGGGASGPLVDALAADLLADNTGAAGELTEDQANCIASGVVSGVGEDKLAEYGITADSVNAVDEVGLSEEDAGAVADAFADCVDMRALFLEGMAGDGGMPEEAMDCVSDAIDDDMLRNFLIAGLTGQDPEAMLGEDEGLMTALMECAMEAEG
ncbi:MAG: hypothetical protein MUE34_06415 [Acidimicrobiales bacterium]|nr:hypothetical protein [Acidimicrobiales bacterium]